MDANRFDDVSRLLTTLPSRRRLLHGLVAAGLGFGALRLRETIEAKKKKTKKPKKNEFDCVDVGKTCGGEDGKCCSGICKGKKPKKGQKDKSKCVAHNTGGCTLDRDTCFNPQAAPCSKTGRCITTTGNAPFCAENTGFTLEANCQPCGKDKECEALGFGPGAACVILRTQGICVNGCEGINGSSGTACIAPGA